MDFANYKNELDIINSQQVNQSLLSEDTILDIVNRTITIPPTLTDVVVEGDTNSRILTFKINRYFDGVDLSSKVIRMKYMNSYMESGYSPIHNIQIHTDTFTFDWIIESEAITKQGKLSIAVEFYQNNSLGKKIYIWQTKPAEIDIEKSLSVVGNSYPADYSLHKKFYEANIAPVTYNEIIDTESPISIMGRKILMPSISDLVVSKDSLSQIISFSMPRFFDNVDLSEKVISIKYLNANGNGDRSRGINSVVTEDILSFGWLIDNKVTIADGYVQFAIEFLGYNEKNEFYVWQTVPSQLKIERGLDVDSIIIAPTPSWIQSWELEVDKIYDDMQSQIDKAQLSKDAAKLSEENALASQIASALSETKSKASEINAKTSEDESKKQADLSSANAINSKASEVASALSENNAKESETASNTSMLAAKASEDAAKVSEAKAKASELASKASENISSENVEIVKTKVAEASVNAQNANTSAIAAKASEVSASTSEINASNFATTASEKADFATIEANRAKGEADRASEITGNLGYFNTLVELETQHPTGKAGKFAIIGESNDMYVWNSIDAKWTGVQVDNVINKPISAISGNISVFDKNKNVVDSSIPVSGSKISINNIAVPVDGKNWINVTPSTDDAQYQIQDVCYNGNIFLAVGLKFTAEGVIACVLTSQDGFDWSSALIETENQTMLLSVCYGNGAFIMLGAQMVGENIYNVIFKSLDGITWTKSQLTVTPISIDLLRDNPSKLICYSEKCKLFITCGIVEVVDDISSAIPCVYTSPDGVTWEKKILPTFDASSIAITFICEGDDTLIALGTVQDAYTTQVFTSSDGIIWTETFLLPCSVHDICYGSGMFVACCGYDHFYTSADGIEWIVRDNTAGDYVAPVACYYNSEINLFLAHSNNDGTIALFSSSNGINWDFVYVLPQTVIQSIYSALGIFILLGVNLDSRRPVMLVSNTKLDLSTKLDRPTNYESDNLVMFDSNGAIVDSGVWINNLAQTNGSLIEGNIATFDDRGRIVDSGKSVADFASISTSTTITLTTSGWTGSTAPYTQTVTISGITATNNAHWDASMNATKEQLENAGACFIKATGQAINQITFTAYLDKPTMDIPITVVILG